ncbi:MAG: leucine-rich repeat protein [Treponema sp.]|nr:leucine-rich repeat protein [Treponema sp.]
MKKTAIQTVFAVTAIIALISACEQPANTESKSGEKAVTAFSINGVPGVITGANISVTLPYGTAVTSLAPVIALSPKASVIPASGAARNFTGPLVYTVTAEDGTTQTYTVTVIVLPEDGCFTVTFYADGGTPEPEPRSIAADGTVTEPSPMTKTGFVFDGWYTDTDRTAPWDFAAAVTAHLSLYAKWEADNETPVHTVTFYADGGLPEPGTQEAAHGATINEPPAMTHTYDGYAFTGWYTDTDRTTAWDFATDTVTGNLTLYAKWELKQYTVTFDTSGGSPVPPQTVGRGNRVTRPENNPTNGFYSFRAWFTDPEWIGYFDFYSGITEDATVYAGWDLSLYTAGYTLKDWLLEQSGGDSPDDPIPLVLKFDANAYYAVLQAAGSQGSWGYVGADKYVTVDLSACPSRDGTMSLYSDAYLDGPEKIVSLIVPDTVTRLQNDYFYTNFKPYSTLKAVSGKNVEYIGDKAFRGAVALEHIDFPRAKVIDAEAFASPDYQRSNTVLTGVGFPEATEIGDKAFLGCTNLQSLDFPKVVTIGEYAFGGDHLYHENTVLTSVRFPEATEIGAYAFGSCTALEQVYFPKVRVVQGFGNVGAIVGSGSAIKHIGSAEFPSATSIGREAFNQCAGLESVDLPNVTSIGEAAFNGCISLSSVALDFPAITSISDLAFSDTLLQSANFPNAVSIGYKAFYNCPNLEEVNFPNVTSIDVYAMGYDDWRRTKSNKLTSVDFPKVTSIGNYAFAGCLNLRTANFPVLERIEDYAFANITIEGQRSPFPITIEAVPKLQFWNSSLKIRSFARLKA